MKILRVKTLQDNAFDNIKTSLKFKPKVSFSNSLDACGCTGNSQC